MKLMKLVLPVIIGSLLVGIWAFQSRFQNKKEKYTLEISSVDQTPVVFNASILMNGQSIRLTGQKTPYKTEIVTDKLECLLDASDHVLILLKDREGQIQNEIRAAYICSEGGVKRILGM